jgi:hypothetical protein
MLGAVIFGCWFCAQHEVFGGKQGAARALAEVEPISPCSERELICTRHGTIQKVSSLSDFIINASLGLIISVANIQYIDGTMLLR